MHVIPASVTNGVDGNLQDSHGESSPTMPSEHNHRLLCWRGE